MSNCIDENYGYMALTKSIDELVAVDEKLEEINSLRLDTLKTLNLLSFCNKYANKTQQNAINSNQNYSDAMMTMQL